MSLWIETEASFSKLSKSFFQDYDQIRLTSSLAPKMLRASLPGTRGSNYDSWKLVDGRRCEVRLGLTRWAPVI
jgi:hypothetical protein